MIQITKRHRKLNTGQLEVLKLLYKFRFGSNDLFAQYFGKKDRSFVYKRLSILLEQGLIAKRFEGSYRLRGKPAAYYLTPAGARKLQEAGSTVVNIKAIYKDGSTSEQFVDHCLGIFAIRNQFKSQYGDDLKFFTKADLNRREFDYFPQPLPAAYIQLKVGNEEKQFFLELFHDAQPLFAVTKRIKQYIDYAEEADWVVTETALPTILIVCASESLAKQMQKRTQKALNDSWSEDEVVFALTTIAEQMGDKTTVWQLADEPGERLALQHIL